MSKGNLKIEQKFAAKLIAQISEMQEEDCDNYISPDEIEEFSTEYFHALVNIMPTFWLNKLTDDNKTLIDVNHLANKLCFQFSNLVDK